MKIFYNEIFQIYGTYLFSKNFFTGLIYCLFIPYEHTAITDYEITSNLLITFLPGEMEHTINMSTVDDITLERDETFTISLELMNGGNGVLLGQSVAIATILDDDGNLRD